MSLQDSPIAAPMCPRFAPASTPGTVAQPHRGGTPLWSPTPGMARDSADAYINRMPTVSAAAPDVRVTLPNGQSGWVQGLLWPEMAAEVAHDPQGAPPIMVSRVKKKEANRLLVEWEHELGPYRRRHGYEAFTLDVNGKPIAAAISGPIVSTTVEGYPRRHVVELARIARHPDHEHVLRVILRLWRAYLAPGWDELPWRARPDRRWTTKLAVAYALPGKTGNLYRFDGWEKIGPRKPSGGGGTWSAKPVVNQIADGVKTLWVWRYERTSSC